MKFNVVNYIFRHRRLIFTVSFFLLIALSAINCYLILTSPDDYLQGISVRIMYIHVPFAWLSLGLYIGLSMSSILYLIYRSVQFIIIARAIAPVGLILTILTLITGSLWGKPTWGTYWVWDARLTSMLFLAFIYLGYITIISSGRSAKISAISSYYAIFGLINIPIIKFSVSIWNTLHQGASIITATGIKIHDDISLVLLFAFSEILVLSCTMVMINICIQMLKLKLNKIAKTLTIAAIATAMLSTTQTKESLAGSWVQEKGDFYTSTSIYYAGRYSTGATGDNTDGAANDFSYETYSKLRHKGFSLQGEYGVTEKFTIAAYLENYAREDVMHFTSIENAANSGAFKLKSNYWYIDPRIAGRYSFYKGDNDTASVELEFYPGTYYTGGDEFFDDRSTAARAWVGYAKSFTLPFGMKNRPKDGSYVDLRMGPGLSFKKGKTEFNTSLELGVAPFSPQWLIITGLYSNFNSYTPEYRSISRAKIAAAVSGLTASNENKAFAINNLVSQRKIDSTGDFHQLGFQIGYKFNDKTTLYAKSYHNVFDSKPFVFNAFYLSLDYTY